jgi:hypothetical protein
VAGRRTCWLRPLPSRILNPFSGTPSNHRISARGFRRSGFAMRPNSPPIIIPPESGCHEHAAMKAPVANAAGKDASPSVVACDTRAPIYFCAVTRGRCRRLRLVIRCQFATATMSAVARRLLLFATLCKSAATKPDRDENRVCICPRTRPPKPLAAPQDASSESGRSKRGPTRLRGWQKTGANKSRV